MPPCGCSGYRLQPHTLARPAELRHDEVASAVEWSWPRRASGRLGAPIFTRTKGIQVADLQPAGGVVDEGRW